MKIFKRKNNRTRNNKARNNRTRNFKRIYHRSTIYYIRYSRNSYWTSYYRTRQQTSPMRIRTKETQRARFFVDADVYEFLMKLGMEGSRAKH